ncbi:MAG TPA: hypothetical protein VF173_06580 [Thermoanaerobaculia bacterium]|nr:hypothetical protein [Thermoanaerobaculia bacterium]
MSHPKSANAFSPAFLEQLDEKEDAGPVSEAELAGPWKVVKVETGYGLFEVWQTPDDSPPFAVFADRATALKFSAALSAASREPLFRLDEERTSSGFPVLSGSGREEGILSYFDDRALELAHMADYCTRSPLALAAVMEAAGPTTLRKAGFLLLQAIEEQGREG